VPEGGEGELLIRGPQVMVGYLNNPQATSDTIDEDGWLHTGDVGRFDEHGHLHIVDRVKELIKFKGFQVPPAELEALLITHPAVADVAVIGIPDEEAGELPKAFVVKAPGADVTPEALQAFVSERVATYKQVRSIQFVEEIPKSASGKILRRFLRDGTAPDRLPTDPLPIGTVNGVATDGPGTSRRPPGGRGRGARHGAHSIAVPLTCDRATLTTVVVVAFAATTPALVAAVWGCQRARLAGLVVGRGQHRPRAGRHRHRAPVRRVPLHGRAAADHRRGRRWRVGLAWFATAVAREREVAVRGLCAPPLASGPRRAVA
jgi:hypothetical protein